jgi:metal-sulfur cluster biosynthetic enzyme
MDTADRGQQVRAALHAVVEPELGRPVTALGFIEGVVIDGGRVHVRLRVPPFFDRDRYGWLIRSDADAALRSLPWVEATDVCFGDPGAPPTDDGRRDEVRRAAFLHRQYRLVRELLDRGLRRSELSRLRLGELPPTAETAVLLRRRHELGLLVDADAPVVVTETGAPVLPDEMDDHVARLRAATAASAADDRW